MFIYPTTTKIGIFGMQTKEITKFIVENKNENMTDRDVKDMQADERETFEKIVK